ncbi:MAG: anhydro-N-acetylmuramic acid kinase [Rhodospirillales bacterium]
MKVKTFRSIGLMSGTSMDGIDVALIETNGHQHTVPIQSSFMPYSSEFRSRLRKAINGQIDPKTIEDELTELHAEAVKLLLQSSGSPSTTIDIVGFHGHTVKHRPAEKLTWQIGDGELLARRLGIKVAYDFRSADVMSGGEGAPLAPIYHSALAAKVTSRPLAIVNIGGVSNITWIGNDGAIIACDVGPGNGPIDDWVLSNTGHDFDKNGQIARNGLVDENRVIKVMSSSFFTRPPPKSLDRLDFTQSLALGQTLEDGAATLTEITARSIISVTKVLPSPPKLWLITGGGRKNAYLMERLQALADATVDTIESIGINGDDLEAQAFAYLAVRTELGLPISFPKTTGAPVPMPGGQIALPT